MSIFLKTELYVHRPAPKKGLGKRCDKHTHKHQTDRIGPIRRSSGVVFWTAKSPIPLADASKRCPENNTPNSLRNPVNGHLRLASVVALSSSGACGAKTYRGAEKVSAFFVSGVSSLFHSVVEDGAKIIAPACFSGRWHQKKCPTDRETVH